MNLNDTRSRGKLSEDDLRSATLPGVDIDAVHFKHRLRGLDQQGRYPDAAEDIELDDLRCAKGCLYALVITVSAAVVAVAFWVALA